MRLLTDPVLRDRGRTCAGTRRRPRTRAALDAVLVSHVHYDHLDRPSLRRVAKQGVVAVVPVGAERYCAAAVRAVRQGARRRDARRRRRERRGRPGVARRPPPPGPGAQEHDTLGFLADGIWFAGDTDLHADMAQLRGRVDVALIPIWGWGPTLGPGHLDPEAAARAVALIRPRLAIPIHWGTYLPIGVRQQPPAPSDRARRAVRRARRYASAGRAGRDDRRPAARWISRDPDRPKRVTRSGSPSANVGRSDAARRAIAAGARAVQPAGHHPRTPGHAADLRLAGPAANRSC